MAPFVNPRNGGKTIQNAGYETKSYTPPLLAPNKVTTEADISARSPGEELYSGKTPAERAVEKLVSDFTELDSTIIRREEWMCAQAIFAGKIPIIGEGVNDVIDFKFTNKEEITIAAKKWGVSTSDPIADLERWHEAVQKSGFVNCDICIMSKDVANAFINHEKVMKVLDVKAYEIAVIKPRQLPNGVTYIGSYPKLGLDFYTYNEWFLDDWTNPALPAELPLVPEKSIALMSTAAQCSLLYGAVTILAEGSDNFITVEGIRVPQSWVERRPDRRFLQINSKPLAVPHEVNSWYVAKVL